MPQGGIMNPISDQLRRSSEFRAAGHWGDDTLVTLIDRWADADPGHPYLSDGTGELTYGEFRAQAWNLPAALAERGVKPGDRLRRGRSARPPLGRRSAPDSLHLGHRVPAERLPAQLELQLVPAQARGQRLEDGPLGRDVHARAGHPCPGSDLGGHGPDVGWCLGARAGRVRSRDRPAAHRKVPVRRYGESRPAHPDVAP